MTFRVKPTSTEEKRRGIQHPIRPDPPTHSFLPCSGGEVEWFFFFSWVGELILYVCIKQWGPHAENLVVCPSVWLTEWLTLFCGTCPWCCFRWMVGWWSLWLGKKSSNNCNIFVLSSFIPNLRRWFGTLHEHPPSVCIVLYLCSPVCLLFGSSGWAPEFRAQSHFPSSSSVASGGEGEVERKRILLCKLDGQLARTTRRDVKGPEKELNHQMPCNAIFCKQLWVGGVAGEGSWVNIKHIPRIKLSTSKSTVRENSLNIDRCILIE